jgi:2,4-dienoyl-CoA reductase-like NADH-dependent reductase (Old Yellow Enzyme family)
MAKEFYSSETFMSILFEPYDFCGLTLKNRFVRSATLEGMATEEKVPSELLLDLYEELAKGGVGLIITSAVRADRSWDPSVKSRNLCLDRDRMVSDFSRLAERVHRHDSRIALQLGTFYRFRGELVCPSPLPFEGASGTTIPRALEEEEIATIVEAYGDAARRAREAGFDAVQINAAHGFPLSRFLSPVFNRRKDGYGGSPESRSRIVVEIAEEIVKKAGREFPVLVKMNVSDFSKQGLFIEDAVEVARTLTNHGISAIETSGGASGQEVTWLGAVDDSKWMEGYFAEYGALIRKAVNVPTIAVGGLRDLKMMEALVREEKADLVAMSRPFIREPLILERWRNGDSDPSDCSSCNGCLDLVLGGQPLQCALQ